MKRGRKRAVRDKRTEREKGKRGAAILSQGSCSSTWIISRSFPEHRDAGGQDRYLFLSLRATVGTNERTCGRGGRRWQMATSGSVKPSRGGVRAKWWERVLVAWRLTPRPDLSSYLLLSLCLSLSLFPAKLVFGGQVVTKGREEEATAARNGKRGVSTTPQGRSREEQGVTKSFSRLSRGRLVSSWR